jgi:hypothetical protein
MHLCLSQVEGFGHYINESRAMGALIITVDAPPMNELVDEDCGILITPSESEPAGLGMMYRISEDDIEQTIESVLTLPESRKIELGKAASERFAKDQRAFYERCASTILKLR